MNINSVSAVIEAYNENELSEYGFDFDFIDGLNILTGHNSSGKSTVLSCIYYCLGLEQLIGNRGAKALSPALHEHLKIDSRVCRVKTSRCFLEFTGKDDKKFRVSRWIVDESGSKNSHYEIEIEEHGQEPYSKYIQSEQDHGDHGFYSWLAKAIGLDIVEIESSEGKSSKPLYIQNIFTSAFIEQTKGWADYFSMMPTFGIKDVKQKVVEYCLGLNSLEVGAKRDEVKLQKDEWKNRWKVIADQLQVRAKNAGIHIAAIDNNTPQVLTHIKKIKAIRLSSQNAELEIDSYIEEFKSKILNLKAKVEDQTTGSLKDPQLIEKQKDTKFSLSNYENELQKVLSNLNKEKLKKETYLTALQDIEFDLKDFRGLKKISLNRNWGMSANPHCPVCDSNLSAKANFELPEEKVTKTLEFLKSKRNTYETYLSASESVIQKYSVVIEFYKKKILHYKNVLDSLFQDMKQPQIFAVSSSIQEQVELEQKLIEVEFFKEYFLTSLVKLQEASEKFYFYVAEDKKLKVTIDSDGSKIKTFKNKFVSLLKDFGYKSNGTYTIDILQSGYHRLLPVDKPFAQEAQSIRFVSSASDFVRSIWAYYLALLTCSERHPGFLVFDEPGQHQMRVDSMKSLLNQAVKMNRQVIFAISQDRNFDDKRVNIDELKSGFDPKKLKVIHIDDRGSCITRN
jgi:hypothetical protein